MGEARWTTLMVGMAFRADMKRPSDMQGLVKESRHGRYRYQVSRVWGDGPRLVVVVNRAGFGDDNLDDRSIRLACARARRWGFAGVELVSLFAARVITGPELAALADPVGPRNNETIRDLMLLARKSGWPVLIAWGPRADRRRAGAVLGTVLAAGPRVFHLGITATREPKALESALPSTRPMLFDPRLVRRVG